MATQNAVWIFCADAGKGTLWRCTVTERGSSHVEKIDTIANDLIGHEHNRPSPLAGKNHMSHAAEGHEQEEMLQRFVREVAQWLHKRITEHELKSVTLFAAPRFLGEWRKVQPNSLSQKVEMREADLTNLTGGALAKHPAVLDLLLYIYPTDYCLE